MSEEPKEPPPTSWLEFVWRFRWPLWWIVFLSITALTTHGELIKLEFK